jgi:hypothetical protein
LKLAGDLCAAATTSGSAANPWRDGYPIANTRHVPQGTAQLSAVTGDKTRKTTSAVLRLVCASFSLSLRLSANVTGPKPAALPSVRIDLLV